MQIRVKKGFSVKNITVDAICSCNGHAIAQRVGTDCKISYYTRDSGQLFWSERPCKRQTEGYVKVIRRLI